MQHTQNQTQIHASTLTPTRVSHYRQYPSLPSSPPTSLEESSKAAHAHYHQSQNSNNPLNVDNDILAPRDEAQLLQWQDEAHRRATGRRNELYPRNDVDGGWKTRGRTIYDAGATSSGSSRPALGMATAQNVRVEAPKTPVRNGKQSASPSTMKSARYFAMAENANNGKPLHEGVSEALVEAMRARYSPVSSPAPSLTYSSSSSSSDASSDSGDEDMSPFDSVHASPMPMSGTTKDYFGMDCDSLPGAYNNFALNAHHHPGLIANMKAEIARANRMFLAEQEELAAVKKADLLFAEFINVDGCADVPMEF